MAGKKAVDAAPGKEKIDYVDGSDCAGFCKVADAMLAYGVA